MKTDLIDGLKNGKNFETYVGFMISKELNSVYTQGNKYSFNDEKKCLVDILNESNDVDNKIKEELIEGIESYEKKIKDEMNLYSDSSSTNEEKSDDNNISNNKIVVKKKEKNNDIKGDFDLIFPNIETTKFMNMLKNNFNKIEKNKYIYYNEEKLNNLPEKINIIIEVGLNAFADQTINNKIKQIQKYIFIFNFINIINDNGIREQYMKNFIKKHSLNQNLKKNEEISNKFIYLIISNSEYGQFTRVFFDKKQFKNNEENNLLNNNLLNNNLLNNILKKNSKELILFGFVNFEQNLNYNFKIIQTLEEDKELMLKKIEEQKLMLIKQDQEMVKMKKKLNDQEEEMEKMKKNSNNREEEMEKMKKKLNDLELKYNSLTKENKNEN